MSQPPRISESEWEVMKICWSRSPVTAQEITGSLAPRTQWHPKTVKTLINRLVNKGALGFTRDGRAYLYQPLVAETDCISAESKSFLERVFGGSLKPMLAHFVESRALSQEEIGEMRKMLKGKAKK